MARRRSTVFYVALFSIIGLFLINVTIGVIYCELIDAIAQSGYESPASQAWIEFLSLFFNVPFFGYTLLLIIILGFAALLIRADKEGYDYDYGAEFFEFVVIVASVLLPIYLFGGMSVFFLLHFDVGQDTARPLTAYDAKLAHAKIAFLDKLPSDTIQSLPQELGQDQKSRLPNDGVLVVILPTKSEFLRSSNNTVKITFDDGLTQPEYTHWDSREIYDHYFTESERALPQLPAKRPKGLILITDGQSSTAQGVYREYRQFRSGGRVATGRSFPGSQTTYFYNIYAIDLTTNTIANIVTDQPRTDLKQLPNIENIIRRVVEE